MVKKSSESLARGARTKTKGASTWVTYDSESLIRYFLREQPQSYGSPAAPAKIDYSDIPALTKDQMKKARRPRVGRPPFGVAAKKMISLKIDPILLDRLKVVAKRQGKGYQTLIGEILTRHLAE